MTAYEKAEIRRLPKKYRPMRAIGFIFYSILYAIPVLGWICLIANAVSDRNVCRRSYARSYLLSYIVAIIAVAVLAILIFVLGVIDPSMFEQVIPQMPNEI